MLKLDYSDAIRTECARKKRARVILALLAAGLVAAYLSCVCVGAVHIPLGEVWDTLLGHGSWADDLIIRDSRVPRLICAGMVGAALSLGGMAMQALFKNPMGSPTVLGISSGASFGAALYIAVISKVFALPFGTMLFAFSVCISTLFLDYALAYKRIGGVQTTTLLLAGMAISSLFGGLTSMIEFFSDEDTVAAIVFWMMGSFDGCQWKEVWLILIPVVVGSLFIVANLRELNMMTAGESKARALGVNVKRVRLQLLVGSSLLVAGTVSVCGSIGFVGLVIPHIFRILAGPDHRRLAPLCILGGALFLILVDTFSRGAMPPYELPVSTVTSLIGAPFFMWILRSRKNQVWRQ